MEKNTTNLINKYNKSVDSIKNQELAIEKVKNKLDELTTGNKTPTSIKNLESELKRSEKEVENLEKQYQQTIDAISKKQVDLEFAQGLGKTGEVSAIKIEQGNLDTKSLELATKLENARDKAEKLKISLQEAKLNFSNSTEIQELTTQLENMNSKLSQTKNEANQTKDAIQEAFEKKHSIKFGSGIDEIGKKIDKFKKRVTGLMLSSMLFNALSSGLTKMRNNFISLLKTNDTFSSSLNQIKANLMTSFAPIYNACLPAINSLMNALSKITGTIAMFVSSLFGTSLEDAKNQAKGLSKALDDTKKSGEEASGSLASFDNLEVINDSSGSGSGGGASGSGIDYNGEIQYSQRLLDFLNAIKNFVVENKDSIIAFLMGIASGLLAIKLGCDLITSLGIGIMIFGIIKLIQDVISFLKDPTWEGFGKILTDIGIILLGLALILGSIPLAVAAGIALIVGLVISNWNTICGVLGSVGSWIYNHCIKPVADFFVGLFNNVYNGARDIWNRVMGVFSAVGSFFGGIWNTIKSKFTSIGTKIGNAIGGAFKSAINSVLSTVENGINFVPKNINEALNLINKLPGVNIPKMSTVKLPRLAKGTVIPPRQEFAAILGDQRHGTNIEAPLETIKQANREVLQEFIGALSGLSGNDREIVFRNLTIVAQFGNKDFSKIVVEAVRLAEKELGKPLFVSR